jgi:hypothetical protein
MSSQPGSSADDDGDILQDVYEQYWLHARHVENQVWSYTRMWALVLTGIFTIVGTDLPDDAKAAAALFGAMLSLLGFFVVYSLRVPFLAFALRSEVLAIREFGLDPGYRRFFENGLDFRDEKGVDIPEILMLVYGTVAAGMLFFATYTWLKFVPALVTSVAVTVVLSALYLTRIRPTFTEEKRKAYDQFEE